MKILLVALSVAIARADISLVPSGSYLPGVGNGGASHGGSLGSSGIGGLEGLGSLGGASLGGGSISGSGFISGSSLGGVSLGGGSISGSGFLSGSSFGGGFLSGANLDGSFSAGFGAGDLVHENKQVHFYAAPEEPQEPLRIFVTPNHQRNNRVIFVKAPTYGALRPEVIAPVSVTEDRTRVYVLVKKPEHGGSITIPSTLINKPTKPEVFYVNYKTEQEAQQALAGGLQDESVGTSAHDLQSAQLFAKSLRDTSLGGGAGGFGHIGGGALGISGFNGGYAGIGGFGGGISGISSFGISGSNVLGGAHGGHLGGHSAGAGGSAGHGPVGASGPY